MDKIKGPAAREMDGFVKAYSELPTLQRIRSDNKAASVMKQQRRSSQPFIPQLESLRSIVIANINDTDFDIWEVEEVHGKVKGLEIIAGNIFKHWSFPINLGIDLDLMMAAVEKIGLGYVNENTYHNALHAGDVLHQTHMLTLKTNVVQIAAVEPIHHFSALFAAVIHDYKHPGFNNGYLVNTKDPIAIRYNDKAVLENFHAAEAFQDLTDPSVDIFQRMTPEEYRTARNIIVECVLATDMSRHFNELAIAPIKFATPVEERTFLLSIMLHASDISNPTRPFNTYSKWADAAISEFFSQGDRERDLGLPVSMLCDRNTVTLPKSQIGFINGIVLPMYLVIEQQFPELGYMVDQIRDNLAEWEERAKEV